MDFADAAFGIDLSEPMFVDGEFTHVASSISDVGASVEQASDPLVVGHGLFGIHLDIHAAQADAFTVDAGEIGFPTDSGFETGVQDVVPDIQFPNGGGIDRRDEITSVVWSRDNVLVGSDPIEGWHRIVWEFVGCPAGLARSASPPGIWQRAARTVWHVVGKCEPPTAVAITDHSTLLLSPLENRDGPAGPIFDLLGVRVIVFDEVEQAQMPSVGGGKTADLDVVAHQVVCAGEFGDFAIEELLLVVPARSPAQDATDIEILA